ncbi:MAG: glucokinase [Methylobacteriaceae bacterium]|nr:glucokinase [Methylobacteriaceae bacterium]MBV9245237.1 glucokinase [Methylobacteriaceae bacterium]MBV9634621.1 glucokinase [Methylobacteriaceae bacterium]MBV9703556.1 glucokinase [Methylobacteriaceae bacterium]
MKFPLPAVVCDVGGTNVRCARKDSATADVVHIASLKTHDFPGLAEAVAAALGPSSPKVRSVIACGAGPVVGRALKLTNAPWMIDGPQVAERLGLEQGLLLNDFEAQALSLPTIPDAWLRRIGPVTPEPAGTRLILGPGTGLGIGALLDVEGRFIPVASEACHIDFGPYTPAEVALWPHLERVHGRVTTESVMAGPGLPRLHRARLAAIGKSAGASVDGVAIVEHALADRASEEAETISALWRLIGRFAGDMAIAFCATGGVTLAGGILPRIVDLVDPVAFRMAFEAKAPVDALARRIATQLVMEPDSVLVGMAAIAAEPARYVIDYHTRLWR